MDFITHNYGSGDGTEMEDTAHVVTEMDAQRTRHS